MLPRRLCYLFLLIALCGRLCVAQDNKVDSLQTLLSQSSDTTKVSILIQLAEKLQSKNPTVAIAYAKEADSLAGKLHYDIGRMRALHRLGMASGFNNDYGSAAHYLEQSAIIAIGLDQTDFAAWNYIQTGGAYSVLPDNEKSLRYFLKALDLFERIDNKEGIAGAFRGIAFIYNKEKKHDIALQNYNKALQYYQDTDLKREIPKIYVNIGEVYFDTNNLEEALRYYSLAQKLFREQKNKRGEATATGQLGAVFRKKGELEKALKNYEDALTLDQQSNHQMMIATYLIAQGEINMEMKRFDRAIKLLSKADSLATAMRMNEKHMAVYGNLAASYASLNDFKKAFEFHQLYSQYADSVKSSESEKQINELQVRFESATRDKEIAILKSEKYVEKIFYISAIALLIAIMIIVVLVINRQKLKIRKDHALAEMESQALREHNALVEVELKNKALIEEQLRGQLEFKNKELTTYTLNLIQKNEILENLKRLVEEIRMVPDSEIKPKLNTIVKTINYSFHLDQDWDNFKLHFEEVHQGFFERLLQKFSDLSNNDMKLCALMRLNLGTKEIATILDISPESAKMARHRLRKKLELSTDQNLTSFLLNI